MRRFKKGMRVTYRGNIGTIAHECSPDSPIGDYYLDEFRCYAWDKELELAEHQHTNVVEKKVETYIQRLYCGLCNIEMVKIELVNPQPMNDYICEKCGRIEISSNNYPITIYREVE